MAEVAVVNASPLIFLSRPGLLELLQLVSSEIIIPEIVATEIKIRGESDPTVPAIANTAWLLVTQTAPVPTQIQSWGLGPGGSSVRRGQAHPGAEAILDDLAARRCAAGFNIPVRGTLGLALIAKQRGRVPSTRQVLELLRLRAGCTYPIG